MRLLFSESALKDLSRLPTTMQRRIVNKLEEIAQYPNPLSLARPLSGYHGFVRYRVGMYRIVTEPTRQTLIIHIVEKRDKAYRDL